jgi:type III restriction enzyme
LLKGQFVLRRKLREQLDKAKAAAYGEGFQELMFNGEIETSSAPDHAFTYPPDFSMYPAHNYYHGDYRFQKHYYPVPADLKWRTDSGKETEEFQCARALDMIDGVKFWVRNLDAHFDEQNLSRFRRAAGRWAPPSHRIQGR